MNLFGIILNSTDLGLLAIAGACLAWFVPHRLSVSRERRARCVAACANFRAAFNADISEISSPARLPDIYVYLAKRFPTHDAAVRELSTHAGWFSRKRLTKDWAAYGNSIADLRQRYSDEAGYTEAEKRRSLAVERLKKVVAHSAKT